MNRIVLTLAMMLPMVCPVDGHIPEEAEAEESNFSGGMWPSTVEYFERPSSAEQVAALPKLNKAPSPTEEEKEQGFIVWWPDYSLKVFEENPPAARGEPECITPKNEFEPLLIGVWGLRDVGEVTLRGAGAVDREWSRAQPPGCRIPSEVRVVNWRRRYAPLGWEKEGGGREVGIPIYLTKDITVNVTTGHNSVFWVTFKAGDIPGKYLAKLQLLVRKTGKRIQLRAEVEVLDLDIPPADIAFGNYVPIASGIRDVGKERGGALMTEDRMRTYIKDMADHGQNSLMFYDQSEKQVDGKAAPVLEDLWCCQYRLKAGGPLIDWDTKNGRLLKYAKEVGLLQDGIAWIGSSVGGDENAEYRQYIAEEVAAQGLPPVLAYGPTDEPFIWKAKDLVPKYEAHAASTSFEHVGQITASCQGLDAALFGTLNRATHWMPSIGTVNHAIKLWAEALGSEMWVYDCAITDYADSTQARYNAGLYMWGEQLKGNMMWAYVHGPVTSFETMLERYKANPDPPDTERYCANDGGYIYSINRGYEQVMLSHQYGIIPTIRWEGRREGVEDYRILSALEKVAPEGSEAANWLADLRNRVDWFVLRNAVGIVNRKDIVLYSYTGDFASEEIPGIRKQAMQYLLPARR